MASPQGTFRNEDYVGFLDESGEANLEVVAGVLIPVRWLRGAERRWRDFIRHQLGSGSGKTEIHAQDLLNGQGSAAYFASLTSVPAPDRRGARKLQVGSSIGKR